MFPKDRRGLLGFSSTGASRLLAFARPGSDSTLSLLIFPRILSVIVWLRQLITSTDDAVTGVMQRNAAQTSGASDSRHASYGL